MVRIDIYKEKKKTLSVHISFFFFFNIICAVGKGSRGEGFLENRGKKKKTPPKGRRGR